MHTDRFLLTKLMPSCAWDDFLEPAPYAVVAGFS
jgi:hypothetical protein